MDFLNVLNPLAKLVLLRVKKSYYQTCINSLNERITEKSFWDKYTDVQLKKIDVSCMWILENYKRLTEEVDRIMRRRCKNISTSHFSTEYSIVHDLDLVHRISSLIALVFNKFDPHYINVNGYTVLFSSTTYKGYHSWEVSMFIK